MQKTPFTFDVSVPEFFAPLMAGATMVIARPKGHMDSDYLAALIEKERVTDIHFVPAMLAVFLEERDLAARCATLRRVTCSGEALPSDVVARFFETFGDRVELLNLYGPTEAAVEVTHHVCKPGEDPVPIGRSIANTQCFILDRSGQPAPVGVPGELWLGGANIARGYLGRPDLTAEKFVDGQYRTGDLAKWNADGEIVFLGRLDHQVKIRGFRIELGEIESVLNAHPGVKESVVVAREQRLVAYATSTNGRHGLVDALRSAVRAKLPEYMMPAAFVFLPALPTNANGKIDRKALPAPEFGAEAVPGELRSPLEENLSALWQELLAVPHVGLNENFFELGGDSLLGLRMVNQLRQKLGEHLSLVVVFEAPTVAGLAKLLEQNYAAAAARWTGVTNAAAAEATQERVTPENVARMREIAGGAPAIVRPATRNPRAAFILSPMRSGSTLLRIMLAGSPRLFSPPELQLLQFNTLRERADAFVGYDRYMQEGTVRALMELMHVEMEPAQAAMGEGSVPEFYRRMQDLAAPRMLVDKTPDYAMDLDVLRRAEEWFEDPLYIHLVRHPLGMIRSYEKGRFILESPYRGRHDFSARQMAELTWLISHQNILEFFKEIPSTRQRRVRFEDVVQSPEREMQALGDFLGVGYDPGMVQPYENGNAKMTDGVHAMSPQVGDFNFAQHGALKPEVAEKWKAEYTEDSLSEMTRALVREFGYGGGIAAVSRESRRVKRSALTSS